MKMKNSVRELDIFIFDGIVLSKLLMATRFSLKREVMFKETVCGLGERENVLFQKMLD